VTSFAAAGVGGWSAEARREGEDKIMDMRKYTGTAYLKVGDVRAGPIRAVISDVEIGKFDKPDAVFEDGSKLSINATNARELCRAYGADSATGSIKRLSFISANSNTTAR
jgi:hypothetical protein